MKKLFTRVLMLVAAVATCASGWAEESEWVHVETPRSWSFTSGKNHASEVTAGDYWTASSNGRFALAVDLVDQELPSNTGAPLTGLEGLYFTVGKGAVYGITKNYQFQNGKMTVRIPNCGKNDEIIVDFSGAGGEATVTSDNITAESLVMASSVSAQKAGTTDVATRVKENGDVILNMSCGKGFRLYAISVTPYIAKERHFTDFAINFQNDPYTVTLPADGQLPEGVTVDAGTFHDAQHGYQDATVTVPVDGAVEITIGNCQYNGHGATIKKGEDVLATLSCGGDCNSTTTWTYNSDDEATLTIVLPSYCPSLSVKQCDKIPDINVTYYNTDGKEIGKQVVPGGEGLTYAYGVADVTVPEGQAFRGWFASKELTAEKVAEGTSMQTDCALYARATKIEEPTAGTTYNYDLTKTYFYLEDHEGIEIDGKYYNNHGWLVNKEGAIKVNVASKAYVSVGCCAFSGEQTAVVTNAAGEKIAEFPAKVESDGAEYTFQYDGEAGWLTITFPEGAYIHSVSVSNVAEFVAYDEKTGYYEIPAGDAASFLIALKAASAVEGAKIFLPNGTYDLGYTVLTPVNGTNISIIGESREGTIITNYPPLSEEGISKTATLLNRATGLYMQDLTLRNAMPFDGKAAAGRAVALQDKGNKTICKNVSLESYQDTYYSNNANSYFYFEDGEIHGVTDYVCGGGDVYFNRVKFVNEAVKNTTIAAPNGALKYGYVMNNCQIETLCDNFNFGRSWGNFSGLAWLNTTINQPSKLASSRFTIAGMNCAADKFVEYNTTDASGKVLTPSTNVINFTHSSGNKQYETVLTPEQAAEYDLEKVFPDWRPEEEAAQVVFTLPTRAINGVFLIDGKITRTIPVGEGIKIRMANARGGFGPETTVDVPTGIEEVADVVATEYFNLQGLRVDNTFKGLVIKVETLSNGRKLTEKTILK